MTIILAVPSQTYAPQTATLPFVVPVGTKRLKATVTRESWPTGPVGSITITQPDGSPGGGVTFNGGDVFFRGVLITTSSYEMSKYVNGVQVDLPVGTYSIAVGVLQTINTAITVELF